MKPLVSIILPVFNSEEFLSESISSIINQTYDHFELIIIDDASTDKSSNLIKSFKDSRVIYIKNERNLGIASSLNIGIKKAKGKYLARMDDDDISEPKRLDKQVRFMEENTSCGLLGTYAKLIGNKTGIPLNTQLNRPLNIKNNPKMLPKIMNNHLNTFNTRLVSALVNHCKIRTIVININIPKSKK